MALTGTSRGSGSALVANTPLRFNPQQNFTSGTIAILCVAYDNGGTNGTDSFSTLTDTLGNTWTSRQNILRDPGAANAGSVLRIFSTNQNGGTLQTTTGITMSYSGSTPAKAWALMEISSSVGSDKVSFVNSSSNQLATGSPSLAISCSNGDMVIGSVGREANSTRTQDNDTLNGSWSTAQATGTGSTTSGHEITTQRKVVTASSVQVYNPTFSTSADLCIACLVLREVIGGITFVSWINSNEDY